MFLSIGPLLECQEDQDRRFDAIFFRIRVSLAVPDV